MSQSSSDETLTVSLECPSPVFLNPNEDPCAISHQWHYILKAPTRIEVNPSLTHPMTWDGVAIAVWNHHEDSVAGTILHMLKGYVYFKHPVDWVTVTSKYRYYRWTVCLGLPTDHIDAVYNFGSVHTISTRSIRSKLQLGRV